MLKHLTRSGGLFSSSRCPCVTLFIMADPTFAPLPEVIIKILGYLSVISKSTLLNLRLVDQRTCSLATPVAFQSLSSSDQMKAHHKASPKLRCPSSSPSSSRNSHAILGLAQISKMPIATPAHKHASISCPPSH